MINEPSYNACEKYEARLEDFIEGQLNASGLKDLRAHLSACAACSEALAFAEGSVRLLRIAEPLPDPGPQFSRMVMARIRADEVARVEERASFWSPLVSLSWRFAATAAFALVLLVTYDVVGNPNSQTQVAVMNQTQANQVEVNQQDAPGIFTPEPLASPATRDDVLLMVADTNYGSN